MTLLITFLSLEYLRLSSFATARPDKAVALAEGFLAISTSCCNDSGDPGLAASCNNSCYSLLVYKINLEVT